MDGKKLILQAMKSYRIFIALRRAVGCIVDLFHFYTFTVAAHLEVKQPTWIRMTYNLCDIATSHNYM
jgi:hypothetical protein